MSLSAPEALLEKLAAEHRLTETEYRRLIEARTPELASAAAFGGRRAALFTRNALSGAS